MAIGFESTSAAHSMSPQDFFAAHQHQLPWFLAAAPASATSAAAPPSSTPQPPVPPQRADDVDVASVASSSCSSSDSEYLVSSSSKTATRRAMMQRRRKWSKNEDRTLREAVEQVMACGDGRHKNRVSWTRVAKLVPRRTAKQCRDRWNTVAQGLRKREWTIAEDQQLLRLYATHKNSWVTIASEMEGRNDNMVKSRFRSLMKSERFRMMLRNAEESTDDASTPSLPSPPPSPAAPAREQEIPMTPQQLMIPLPHDTGVEQHILPPTPAPLTMRQTSDLFAGLRFGDGLDVDEELGQWCSGLVN